MVDEVIFFFLLTIGLKITSTSTRLNIFQANENEKRNEVTIGLRRKIFLKNSKRLISTAAQNIR